STACLTVHLRDRSPGLAQLLPERSNCHDRSTPGRDVYMYSFGNTSAEIVLHHVSYGTLDELGHDIWTLFAEHFAAQSESRPGEVVEVEGGLAEAVGSSAEPWISGPGRWCS